MMNVVLGHFDLEVIRPQVDSLADSAEVGPRRTLELGLQTGGAGTTGTRIRIPGGASERNRRTGAAGGTAERTGAGRTAGRTGAGRSNGRHAASSARATTAAADAPRRHHVTDGARRGSWRPIAADRTADSGTAESGEFGIC